MNKESIEKERNRDSSLPQRIYLYRDGNSNWYTAYEWSAYLMEFFKNGLKENDRLKPTLKKVKGIEGNVVYVGIQPTSFKKYIPNASAVSSSNDAFEFDVDLSEYAIDSENGQIGEALLKWKSTLNVSSNTKSEQRSTHTRETVFSNPVTFLSIMKEILRYDLKTKTESENFDFISKLKEKCLDLIC